MKSHPFVLPFYFIQCWVICTVCGEISCDFDPQHGDCDWTRWPPISNYGDDKVPDTIGYCMDGTIICEYSTTNKCKYDFRIKGSRSKIGHNTRDTTRGECRCDAHDTERIDLYRRKYTETVRAKGTTTHLKITGYSLCVPTNIELRYNNWLLTQKMERLQRDYAMCQRELEGIQINADCTAPTGKPRNKFAGSKLQSKSEKRQSGSETTTTDVMDPIQSVESSRCLDNELD